MSNPKANNAVLTTASNTKRYLRVDKDGVPLQRQVPRTRQIYTGTGGDRLIYDGSNDVIINQDNLNADLIFYITDLQNWVGRNFVLHLLGTTKQTITIDTSPVLMQIAGTALLQLTHVIPGDQLTKAIFIHISEDNVIVDYGASSSSVVAPFMPTFVNIGGAAGVYESTAGTTVNLRSIRTNGFYMASIQNASTITIANNQPLYRNHLTRGSYAHLNLALDSFGLIELSDNRTIGIAIGSYSTQRDGSVTLLSAGTFTGPGNYSSVISYVPSPRRTEMFDVPIIISDFALVKTYELFVRFTPNLANVFDKEFVSGSNTTGTLGMYDLSVTPTVAKLMVDSKSNTVNLGANLSKVAFDIQDSILFYTLSTSPNVIRYKTFADNLTGVLFTVTGSTAWTVGANIADLEYNEHLSILFVLPDNPVGRLLGIPISPYASGSGTVIMGAITFSTLILPVGSVPHSLAICRCGLTYYISYKPLVGNVTITALNAFGNFVATQSLVTTFAAGTTSMMIGSRSTLLVQTSTTNQLYQLTQGKSIADGITLLYTMPSYMPSLCRNGYGFTSL